MRDKAITIIKSSTLLRYIFVGGTSYAIELSVLLLLIYVFHANTALAVSIGFWLGLIISFILQKFLAFGDKDTRVKRLTIQSFYYGLLVAVNYTFTLVFVHYLSPILTILVARTVALIITTVWNFFVYKKIIFKEATG